MDDKLVNLIADLKEKETLAMVKEKIGEGIDPLSVLDDAKRVWDGCFRIVRGEVNRQRA